MIRGFLRTPAIKLVLLALVGAALGLSGLGNARAQNPQAGSVLVFFPGWNLVSFGPASGFSNVTELGSPLYYLQPGDTAYRTGDIGDLTAGVGYWAYFTARSQYNISKSDRPSAAFTVPAGQCITVGNPSTNGSARVLGADAVFVYSNVLENYIQESLLPIGRGAFACNYSSAPENVTVADEGDISSFSTSDLPTQPYQGMGMAQIVVKNDTPYPLIGRARQIEPDGTFTPRGDGFSGQVDACSSCPEYAPGTRNGCNVAARGAALEVTPGTYLIHVTIEGRNIPDFQGIITVQANTSYAACFFVDANRPQKDLP